MPKMTIQPNSHFPFDVGASGRYLLVRFADAGLMLGSDAFRSQGIETGDAIDVGQYGAMRFENPTAQAVNVDYQITDLKVATNATQNIVIQRIIEPIQFEASVKVVDGLKVAVMPHTQLNSLPDITIPPNQAVKVTSAALGREQVAIQVISATPTTLRVGSDAVSANTGSLLRGSVDAPASMVLETSAEVHVFNASDDQATVSVTEVIQ